MPYLEDALEELMGGGHTSAGSTSTAEVSIPNHGARLTTWAAKPSRQPGEYTIAEAAERLAPSLGRGLRLLMMRSKPLPLSPDVAAGWIPPQRGLVSKMAGSVTPSGAIRIGVGMTLSGGGGSAQIMRAPVPKVDRDVPFVQGQYAYTAGATQGVGTSQSSSGNGGYLRVDDALFRRAFLLIPILSLFSRETLRACIARGRSKGEPLESSGASQRLSEAFGPVRELLPHIPRPRFADFFGSVNASSESSALALAHVKSGPTWPVSWAQYHATFSALLLEEGRAMMASAAVEVARTLLRQGGGRGPDIGNGGKNGEKRPAIAADAILTICREVKDDAVCTGEALDGDVFQAIFTFSSSDMSLRGLQTSDVVIMRPGEVGLEDCLNATFDKKRVLQTETSPVPCLIGIIMNVSTQYQHAIDDSESSRKAGTSSSTTTIVIRVTNPSDILFKRFARNLAEKTAVAAPSSNKNRGTTTSLAHSPMNTDKCWRIVRIENAHTLHLQYSSIASVAYTPFASAILMPHLAMPSPTPVLASPLTSSSFSPLETIGEDSHPQRPAGIPESMYRALCKRYDASQLRVIFTVACGGAFTFPADIRADEDTGIFNDALIREAKDCSKSGSLYKRPAEVTSIIGPPGTGKTRVVLGIVSALRSTASPVGVAATKAATLAATLAARDAQRNALAAARIAARDEAAAELKLAKEQEMEQITFLDNNDVTEVIVVDDDNDRPPGTEDEITEDLDRYQDIISVSSGEDDDVNDVDDVIEIKDDDHDNNDDVVEIVTMSTLKTSTDSKKRKAPSPPLADVSSNGSDDDDDDDSPVTSSLFLDTTSSFVATMRQDKIDKAATAKKKELLHASKKAKVNPVSTLQQPQQRSMMIVKPVITKAVLPTPVSPLAPVSPRGNTPRTPVDINGGKRVRVLICTPSNAACDEICARLLDLPETFQQTDSLGVSASGDSQSSSQSPVEKHPGGLIDAFGKSFIPTVIRAGVGGTDSTRREVASVSLARHVQRRMCALIGRLPLSVKIEGVSKKPQNLSSSSLESCLPRVRFQNVMDLIKKALVDLRAEISSVSVSAAPRKSLGGSGSITSGAASSLSFSASDSALSSRLRHLRRDERDLDLALQTLQLPQTQSIDPTVAETLRIQAVREVFEGSDIVCTTLAGASQLPNAYQRIDAGWLTCLCDGANTNAATGAADGGGGRRGVAGALAASMTFDAVIVDEAGQAVEPEALTPLRLSIMGHVNASRGSRSRSTSSSSPSGDYCKRLVLVGDPLQLPATVLSRNAAMAGLDVSLFERLAAAGVKPMLLRTQYRMHGEIAKFSSTHFYRGLVRDAPSLSSTSLQRTISFQQQNRLDVCLHPLSLIDVPIGRETRQGEEEIWGGSGPSQAADPSFGNTDEAIIAVAHALHLLELISRGSSAQSGGTATRGLIGIISPYKEQVRRIKNLLQRASTASADASNGIIVASSNLLRSVIVSSVDSFQGQELDHIIITTVRSSSSGSKFHGNSGLNQAGIGFLADKRRLNVAVTRARLSLTLVCNADHLSRFDEDWKELIEHMKKKQNNSENNSCSSLQRYRSFTSSLLNI
jgi:hypothetical protein